MYVTPSLGLIILYRFFYALKIREVKNGIKHKKTSKRTQSINELSKQREDA